jgi:hypothetical protein
MSAFSWSATPKRFQANGFSNALEEEEEHVQQGRERDEDGSGGGYCGHDPSLRRQRAASRPG